ncbi:YdcF family protein [Corallococcus sp. CA047B]|uniref:YdcF family protein n=1 Tax=Corallococcus sp. CA047B TaxID=2316729 RepID=UPI000EA17D53|nr:YdcF family protein [Corallococcus sp. CA047B]RKH00016.1 YdcF family protein [Corallococcus sp. CA047B]
MFLVLSKVLDLLLSPLTWALFLGVGSLLWRRRVRVSVALQLASLAVLYAFSIEPVVALLTRATEGGAVSTFRKETVYDAVILLGGGLDAAATERSGQPEYNAAPERIMRGFELLRDGRAKQVLLSGGTLDARPEAVVEADVLAGQLEHWGIAPERIVKEGRSRNTRENALNAVPLVSGHGWKSLLLVTSAAHLPRAAGCFAAVGIRADTLAVDVRSSPIPPGRMSWLPRAGGLSQSTDMLRELAGRVVYRLRGWTAP